MNALRALIRDERGAAAEFALVLPLAVILMFGIIDGGRYMWEVSRIEKATQAGARIAAVTDMIPQGVAGFSYVLDSDVAQGAPVDLDHFPGVDCTGTAAGGVDCDWSDTPSTEYDLEPSDDAFDQVYQRMVHFLPGLEPEQVTIRYQNSGLGFAGDPAGPDVAPLITVEVTDRDFNPLIGFFTGPWGLPSAPYTLTQEDGAGTCFEEQTGARAACVLS